jgi:hypothetical protein
VMGWLAPPLNTHCRINMTLPGSPLHIPYSLASPRNRSSPCAFLYGCGRLTLRSPLTVLAHARLLCVLPF